MAEELNSDPVSDVDVKLVFNPSTAKECATAEKITPEKRPEETVLSAVEPERQEEVPGC